ncbi:FAD/NAD-P-binding domain-containing protein [Daedaleopsis nitida]|nr:FAD/NAD-P-binding domain-containing protein [Daedaleopsis nitida]
MSLNPQSVASNWLSACASALEGADAKAFASLFLQDGAAFRDLSVFTWDIRCLNGQEKIASYLANSLAEAHITDVQLNETSELAPREFTSHMHKATGVELAFTFKSLRGIGRGLARLVPDHDGELRAWTVLTQLYELPGHPEFTTLPWRDDITGIADRDMQKDFEKWVQSVEADPYVIIVGAAQTGLQIAARFKQLDIPTLVVERLPRVGDTWRRRYPTLTLHTTKMHHTLLYTPFPDNWPEYTPRDKLADWMEHYASIQDLVIWTNSELQSPIKLHPAHLVFATGTLGTPNIPNVQNMERFQGRTVHSSRFPGGALFNGLNAVVVGAGNSAIDIAQDLALRGAKSVTQVQRSRSCVMTRDYVCDQIANAFPESMSLEASDFRFGAMSMGMLKTVSVATQEIAWEAHKELHDKLRKGGVLFDLGPEGQGVYPLVFERLGGYWMDKGGADLIADGRIKFKTGQGLAEFTKNSLVLTDGTELPADLVVFATGYYHMRETNTELLGKDVIDQTEPVYGLDEEGEIKGSYRPSGHPGLWFATGDFFTSRFLSKTLALQVKAIQVGLMPNDGRRGHAGIVKA